MGGLAGREGEKVCPCWLGDLVRPLMATSTAAGCTWISPGASLDCCQVSGARTWRAPVYRGAVQRGTVR